MRYLSTLLLVFLLSACRGLPPDILPGTSPEVRQASSWIGDHLGIEAPVEVRDALLFERGLFGAAYRLADVGGGDGYVILLDPRLSETERTMVLIHEWAHVLVWARPDLVGADDPAAPHGDAWAKAYGVVFRVWIHEGLDLEGVPW